MTDEEMEFIDRLKSGDRSALDDLLEACTGAKISTVEVRFLRIPEFVGAIAVAAAAPPGPGRRRPRRES